MTVIFSRPDGVEHSRVTLTDQGQGGRATTLALPRSAMTGTWRAKVHTDPKAGAIAQASFLVEDFVPERLELKLEPAVQALSPQEPGTIKLAGRYLYGPPAAGLAVEGEIAVKPAKGDLPGFAGYKFGLADEQVGPVRKPLERPARHRRARARPTSPCGCRRCRKTSRPLEADVILKLRESGGRTIERTVTLPVDMKAPRIGIKPLFKGGQVEEGETARFEAILLGADGKAVEAKGLKWELMRLEHRWQWYSRDGSWNFEPLTSTRRVAAGTADAAPGAPAKIEASVDWGRYRLEVSDADGSGLISSIVFNAGYWADEAADSPEVLDVALDKPSLQGRRYGAPQDRLAHGRPRAGRRDELGARQHPGGRSAGRWRRGADPRQRRLESRRLRHRHALSAHGREGQAHAQPRARACAGSPSTRRRACSTSASTLPEKVKSGRHADRARQGRRAWRPARRRASRLPPPTSASSTSRASRRPSPKTGSSASAGSAPRSATLRPPDRRHARRARQAALRRRRLGRRHVHAGQPAGGGDAGLVLRHRQSRRRRQRQGRLPAARFQRHACAFRPWPGAPARSARPPRT